MTPVRRVFILLGSGVFLALLLGAIFRGPLLKPLIVRAVRQTLGLEVAIKQVGGSVLTGLDLRGVSGSPGERGGPLASFEAGHIGARYALLALLRGKEAFLDSLDVTVEDARLDLDLTRPPAAPSQPGEQTALPRLPRFAVRNSQVRVRGPGYTLEAVGLQGAVASADQGGEQPLDIRAERFSLRHPALREGTLAVALTGTLAPRRLSITAAQVNGDSLVEGASLDLGERAGDLDLQLALRLWQGSVKIEMLRRETGTEVRWDARGVDLQPQVLLANPALGALRGRLSTKGEVRLGEEGPATLAGTLNLDWEGGRIAGRALDRLSIEASAEPGVVHVERAEGRIGPNEVRLQRVELPGPPLFAGRWRDLLAATSGSFAASLGDVPAFLAVWGVKAGSDHVAVPDHRLRLEGTLDKGTIRFERGDLAAGPGRVTLDAVTVSLPVGDQGWGETAFAGGATVDIPRLQEVSALFPMPPLGGSLRGGVSVRGTIARPEGSASLTGRGIAVAGRAIGDVDVKARGAAGRIEIDTLQVRLGGNRLAVLGARFSPGALAAADRGGFLDSLAGSFELRCEDLPAVAAIAGIAPERLAPLPAQHLLTAAGTVGGRAISLTTGSFAAAGGTVTLRTARISLPSSWAEWRKDTTFEGDLVVDVPDLGPAATIFRLPPLQGSLTGRTQVAGRAGDLTGSLEASGRGIALSGYRVGNVAAKISARQQLLKIEAIEVTRGEDRLRGHGSYDLEKGTVLDAEADVTVADVAPWIAEFVSDRIPVSGRLHALFRAAGPLPGTPVTVEAEFSDGTVQKVRAVRGTLKGQISVDGPLRRPRVAAATFAAQVDGEAGDRSGRVTLDAGYEPGRLQIRALEARGSGGLTLSSEGTLPVDLAASDVLGPGTISLRTRASMPHLNDVSVLLPPAYRLAGSLGADVVVAGSWKEPQVRLEISGERLELAAGPRFVPPGPYTLAGALTWGAREARVENLRLESAALSCSVSGAWNSPPPLAALLARDAGWATGSLDLRSAFSAPDLGWLRASVEGLRGLRGSVAGEIVVGGPPADPVYSGSVRLAEAAFRSRDLPLVDALNAKVSVAGRTVTLEEVGGNVGGSPFTLTGSVDLSRPADPVLEVRLKGTNALLYRAEGLRVRADSDLTLRGPVSALSLAGEVALTDSVYQRAFSVAGLFPGGGKQGKSAKRPGGAGLSFPEPPLRNMRFDVHLTSREPVRIITSAIQGAARPDLRLTGTGLLPYLRGPILFADVNLVLPSGVLEFERGSLFLSESGPGRSALDFVGRMQTQGLEITAQIGGTIDTPEVILSSVPPVFQEELVLFVLTGAPPGSASASGGYVTAMATPMAVYLGKGVLGQLFGGGSEAGGGLQSRLEVQIGRELTRSGGVTAESRLLVKKNLARKGGSLYITAEQDKYDQDNVGLRIVFKFK